MCCFDLCGVRLFACFHHLCFLGVTMCPRTVQRHKGEVNFINFQPYECKSGCLPAFATTGNLSRVFVSFPHILF